MAEVKMGLALILALFVLLLFVTPSISQGCSRSTCSPPRCVCPSRRGPIQLALQETPQIVLFSFDDSVNEEKFDLYRRFFTKSRKNPNGCRISATFFVSHDWTDYSYVRELYLSGHEIGSHSVTHREPSSWWSKADYADWTEEMVGQRRNIAQKARIPPKHIVGLRVPYLELGANDQFMMMRDNNFEYDSSFMSGPYHSGDTRLPAWPFTLEYPPSLEFCDSGRCPTMNFSGIWEIPLNRWIGIDGRACPMADACDTHRKLATKGEVKGYLRTNLERHLGSNRAPLGIHMHATWFDKEFKVEAMEEFIDDLLQRNDVYIVTLSQMIEWMKQPTPIRNLVNFKPWTTSCRAGRVLLGPSIKRHRVTKSVTSTPTAPPRPNPSSSRGRSRQTKQDEMKRIRLDRIDERNQTRAVNGRRTMDRPMSESSHIDRTNLHSSPSRGAMNDELTNDIPRIRIRDFDNTISELTQDVEISMNARGDMKTGRAEEDKGSRRMKVDNNFGLTQDDKISVRNNDDRLSGRNQDNNIPVRTQNKITGQAQDKKITGLTFDDVDSGRTQKERANEKYLSRPLDPSTKDLRENQKDNNLTLKDKNNVEESKNNQSAKLPKDGRENQKIELKLSDEMNMRRNRFRSSGTSINHSASGLIIAFFLMFTNIDLF